MYAESKGVVNQPADIVYPLVRDELKKLVPFMPNIAKIETIKYERTSDIRLEILRAYP